MLAPLPAYILAGGKSRRFGSDKARAIIGNESLIRRLADQLEPAAASLVVIAEKADKYADLSLATIADEQPHLGPLGGLVTALAHRVSHHGDGWLLLLSCDLVTMHPNWIARLQTAANPPAQAVAFRGRQWEPLAALYHTALLSLARRQLASNQLAMWSLLESAQTASLPLPLDWPSTAQINTPHDLFLAKNAGHLAANDR